MDDLNAFVYLHKMADLLIIAPYFRRGPDEGPTCLVLETRPIRIALCFRGTGNAAFHQG